MPSPTIPFRVPEEKKTQIAGAASDLRMSVSDWLREAADEKLGRDARLSPEGHAAIQALEAEVHRLKIRNGLLQSRLAAALGRPAEGPLRPAMQAEAEKKFTRALAEATVTEPATVTTLSVATGQHRNWTDRRLAILCRSGHARKLGRGEYAPAPGMTEDDLAAGLEQARGHILELSRRAPQEPPERTGAESHGGNSPEAPAEATEPGKGKSAATEGGARRRSAAKPLTPGDSLAGIALRSEALGAPLVAASELKPGTAVFLPAGAEAPVVPVSEVPDTKPGKPRGSSRKRCDHRLPAGAWCKICQQPK